MSSTPSPTGGTPDRSGPAGLSRPRQRWIAGVCSGLGQRFGLSANTVRLLFVLSCLLPGPQFVAYLILWVVMPSE